VPGILTFERGYAVKEIPLTKGFVALVDDHDYEALMSLGKWQAKVEAHATYAFHRFLARDGQKHNWGMHAVIMGTRGNKIVVDHIDGNGLNNQRSNLRRATQTQNHGNSRKRSDALHSSFRGVTKNGKYWRAIIRANNVRRNIGYFPTAEAAARAYDQAAIELFGEFANLNFPKG
jgi:hypothetical protein